METSDGITQFAGKVISETLKDWFGSFEHPEIQKACCFHQWKHCKCIKCGEKR